MFKILFAIFVPGPTTPGIEVITKQMPSYFLALLRKEGASKSLPETFPGQNFRASTNKATLNFTERKYILYLAYYCR
jgi:hypothetical protein